jgi:3-methyladenine DNA glycosylase AlkD
VRCLAEEDVARVTDTRDEWVEIILVLEWAGDAADAIREVVNVGGSASESHWILRPGRHHRPPLVEPHQRCKMGAQAPLAGPTIGAYVGRVAAVGEAPPMKEVTHLLDDLDARMRRVTTAATAEIRAVRRGVSRELRDVDPGVVLGLADRLVERDGDFDRFLAYEIVTSHPPALARLRTPALRRLGRGMDSWGDVDTFACYVAGPAWRERQVADAEIARWARSKDRWWRRAGVVSTVPLNSRARGGSGDAARTLAICRLVLHDSDPMVVKALSWALRELAKRAPNEVERFVTDHDDGLPALVRREVRSKLRTGLKSPRRGARA